MPTKIYIKALLTSIWVFGSDIFIFKTFEVKFNRCCAHFMLCGNDAVLDRKLVLLWVENSIQHSMIPT